MSRLKIEQVRCRMHRGGSIMCTLQPVEFDDFDGRNLAKCEAIAQTFVTKITDEKDARR